MSETIITKYRPTSFDEMVGHEAIRRALADAVLGGTAPHAYLMTGPGGIGKTTTARILANMLECEVLEIDAASNSGVEEARQIAELGNHMSLTGAGRRMIIVDECHTLSKQAWQALLKVLEEPPSHLYFALCTTELAKVPDTIVQRCYHVPLKPVSTEEMEELLLAICEMEEWEPDPDVLTLVIQAATGQPRKALSMLQAVHKAPNKEEAARIITLQEMSSPLIELCKLLVKGPTWDSIKPLLLAIQDEEWKEASLLAGRWLAKAMVMARTEANATRIWVMLDALTFPVDTFDRKIAFYAALGKMLWGENQIGAPEPVPPPKRGPLGDMDDEIPF
jgi:DNA polymerase-3 subunit gamma/tau